MSTEDTDAPSSRPGTTRRWAVLGLLLGIVVAGIATSAWLVLDRGTGDDPLDKLQSLREPVADPIEEREDALAAARTFAQRFNTYGPEMLDEAGKMPDYAAVSDLMTATFAGVFDSNVGYAEETVATTQIDRVGTPYAVGVASIDDDSAEVLVAGVVEFSYPDPDNAGERVSFEPLRFRYQVSLVKQQGEWLVDDLDDLDDELPSFAEASIPETTPPGATDAPTGAPAPSDAAEPSAPAGQSTGAPGDETEGEQ